MTDDHPSPAGAGNHSPAEPTNQSGGDNPVPQPPLANRRPTLGELALGGALFVSDNVGARLQVPEAASDPTPRTLDTVLRPVAEWDTTPAAPLTDARHVAVGVMTDARRGADRGRNFLNEATDTIGQAIDQFTRPVRRSRPMRPLRVRFHRYQERGEHEVWRWKTIGRQEEARSRAIAEASLGSFVQRSVSDLTESDQIQILIQHVVESQSTGMLEEIVEEIRERMVSLDILLDRRVRRSTVSAPPPFRGEYLRTRPSLAVIPQVENTLAGHYAGFASRTAAFFVDVTLLMIALSLVTTFANALVGLFNLDALLGRFMTTDGFAGTLTAAIAGLAGALFVVGYGVLAWSINGETVGGIVIGIRVVRADGGRVSFGRAVIRMVGAYISGLALFLGFFWALFDGRRHGWHDKLAGTSVIYDWPAVPDEQFLRQEIGVRGVLARQQQAP